MFTPLFAMFTTQTLIIVGLVGIILFGNKLPEMGRVVARSIRIFRGTLEGREDEPDTVVAPPSPAMLRAPQRITAPSAQSAERNGLATEPPLA